MAIDFTLTEEQKQLQADARDFAQNVLAPVVRKADAEPDPLRGFQLTKEPYIEAYENGIAMCMIPEEYDGGGVSNVDLIIAAEEVCVVDPGFACTVLCNGLGLMPVVWYGSEEQKDRFLREAILLLLRASTSAAGRLARLPARRAGRRTSMFLYPGRRALA